MKNFLSPGKYNIADWFSVYRIAAVPFLLLLVIIDCKQLFTWFLLLSFLTDMIDGYLARKLNIQSERGAKLDSIGDLLTLMCAITGLFMFEWAFLKLQAPPILLLLSFYFLEIIFSFWRFGKISSFHTYLNKISFFIQGVFILSLLFFGYYPWLFYPAIITGILASIEETILLFLLPRYQSDIKGLYWVLNR